MSKKAALRNGEDLPPADNQMIDDPEPVSSRCSGSLMKRELIELQFSLDSDYIVCLRECRPQSLENSFHKKWGR